MRDRQVPTEINQKSQINNNIYQLALPYYADRIDLFLLDRNRGIFANDWLHQLLENKQLDIEASVTFQASDKVRHLYFEGRNSEKTEGKKVLGFGYPMVITADKDNLIAAPMLIWQISLEPHSQRVNSWTFRHNDTHKITVNHFLLNYLKERHQLDFSDILLPMARHKSVTQRLLTEVCEGLAAKLDTEFTGKRPVVIPAPGIEEIDEVAQKGSLAWTGILGVFPPQTLISGVDISSTIFNSEPIPHTGHPFVLLPNSPQQEQALETVLNHKITLIEGTSGTGKTHLVTNLLTNALSNGQKCLVVSDKVLTLKSIQNGLEKIGFQKHHFLLKDSYNDKSLLLEILKAIVNSKKPSIDFSPEQFNLLLNKCLRQKQKLNTNFKASHQIIFEENNWAKTVGHFLENNRIEGKELLNSQLNPQDFFYNEKEYHEIQADLITTGPLFQKIRTLKHPLKELKSNIFTELSQEEGLFFIQEQSDLFLVKANLLHHQYINRLNDYTEKLTQHYEDYYQKFDQHINKVKDSIDDRVHEYGDSFENSGGGTLKLYGVFSKKYNDILKARNEITKQYLELEYSFKNKPYFDYQFAFSNDGKQVHKIRQNLENFQKELLNWRVSINSIVQEEIQRLSQKNIQPKLDYFRPQIIDLEVALDHLVTDLNDTNLFEEQFKNKMLTIPKRQRYLEQIIEKMESTLLHLRDYESFYDWQHNWLTLSPNAQKVIKALIKVKPHDWMAAFRSWYLNNKLLQAYHPDLPQGNQLLENYAADYYALQTILPNQILTYWEERLNQGVTTFKKENKKGYSTIFGFHNHQLSEMLTLSDILTEGIEAITDVLPILMSTTAVAYESMKGLANHFDYVIFEESHQIPADLAVQIMALGKKIVIVGDEQQHYFFDSTSLLDFLSQQAITKINLDSNPPEETCPSYRFYQVAFGNQPVNLVLSNPNEIGTMQVDHLEGRFNVKEGTNDVEALHVIRLLNQIKKTQYRRLPTVGITCFTFEQRDLISSYLLKIKQKRSTGYEIVQQLERNGMGVYHVSELGGQRFDVMILSSTFGTIDLENNISKYIKILNTKQGANMLQLLTSRALKDVYIINSIPQNYLDDFVDTPEDSGTYLLANYFKYAEAVHKKEKKAIAATLEEVSLVAAVTEQKESLFIKEVATAIAPYLGVHRIRLNAKIKGIEIPLLIEPKFAKEPPVAIFPDGFVTAEDSTSFVWEFEQQERMETLGLFYYPVWSVHWWRNPKQEARKLASWVIKLDGEFK